MVFWYAINKHMEHDDQNTFLYWRCCLWAFSLDRQAWKGEVIRGRTSWKNMRMKDPMKCAHIPTSILPVCPAKYGAKKPSADQKYATRKRLFSFACCLIGCECVCVCVCICSENERKMYPKKHRVSVQTHIKMQHNYPNRGFHNTQQCKYQLKHTNRYHKLFWIFQELNEKIVLKTSRHDFRVLFIHKR